MNANARNAAEKRHVAAIFAVCRLIDANAPAEEIEKARAERDAALKAVRSYSPKYDRAYS